MIVDGTRSGTPVADDKEPAVGESIIFERKTDAGSTHVRFDERERGNVIKEKIETPTKGESRRKQHLSLNLIAPALDLTVTGTIEVDGTYIGGNETNKKEKISILVDNGQRAIKRFLACVCKLGGLKQC